MNKGHDFKPDTLMIHAGHTPDTDTLSIAAPIYQTTAYAFKNTEHARRLFALEEGGNIYTRIQNPTQDVLEQRMAALEGGSGALATASGHSAIALSIFNIAGAGDEIISSSAIYGGAINLFGVSMKKLGITVRFADPHQPESFEKLINDKTRAIFIEMVGNPNANVADIEAFSKIARENGLPLIVDATFLTPALMRPKEFGADIIIHSATKYLGGHGSAMGGIVVDCGTFNWKDNPRFPDFNMPDLSYHGIVFADLGATAFITRLRVQMLRDYGPAISPFNSFLLINGVETLSVRMERHVANADRVALWLSQNPEVERVNYPRLESSPYYALAQKYLPKGTGGIFTFELKGKRERSGRFIDSLKLFSNVANVGDVRSLVIHPATTTHSQLSDEQLKAGGISAGTIRLSVGLEDAEDLIWDLNQAIESSK